MRIKFFIYLSTIVFFMVSCKKDDNIFQNQSNGEVSTSISSPKASKKPKDGIVKDIDGNTYKTVQIGNQVWMAENLRVTRYRNGNPINNVEDATLWANANTGMWCYYGNNSQMDAVYGKLYNWFAVSDSRGLAPKGWHIPTEAEVLTLINYLGGNIQAGGAMKESGTTYWQFPNTGATNVSGFTARPGGHRHYTGLDYNVNQESSFWTTTIYNPSAAKFYSIYYSSSECGIGAEGMTFGYSIRCIKD